MGPMRHLIAHQLRISVPRKPCPRVAPKAFGERVLWRDGGREFQTEAEPGSAAAARRIANKRDPCDPARDPL